MFLFNSLFKKVHHAVVPKRKIELQKLDPTSFAGQAYPNHANFWDTPSDPVVYDTLYLVSRWWGYLAKDGYNGYCNNALKLNDEWLIWEYDDCMSGHTGAAS